jgi:hypothetical protein
MSQIEKESSLIPEETEWFCWGCGCTFPDFETAEMHLETCPDNYPCNACGQTFADQPSIEAHVKICPESLRARMEVVK